MSVYEYGNVGKAYGQERSAQHRDNNQRLKGTERPQHRCLNTVRGLRSQSFYY